MRSSCDITRVFERGNGFGWCLAGSRDAVGVLERFKLCSCLRVVVRVVVDGFGVILLVFGCGSEFVEVNSMISMELQISVMV